MQIRIESIFKIALVCLMIAPLTIPSVEINILITITFFLLVFVNLKKSTSRLLISTVSLLTIILLIAVFSTFFYPNNAYNALKVFFFLLKPILHIIIGYYFVSKIKDKTFIFKTIIYAACIFAIIHLYKSIIFLSNNEFDINLLRYYAGRGNVIEIFAFVILFSKNGNRLFMQGIKYKTFIKLIVFSSIVFYFSRTVTVSIIVLILAIQGYLKLSKRGMLYMAISFFLVTLFYTF